MELGDILFPLVVIYLMMCIFRDIKTMWCSAWAPKHIVAKPKPCNTGASAKTPPNDAHKEVYMLPGQKSKAMHGSKRPKRNTFCFVMHVYAVHQILDISSYLTVWANTTTFEQMPEPVRCIWTRTALGRRKLQSLLRLKFANTAKIAERLCDIDIAGELCA